jgi:hypothetical protein
MPPFRIIRNLLGPEYANCESRSTTLGVLYRNLGGNFQEKVTQLRAAPMMFLGRSAIHLCSGFFTPPETLRSHSVFCLKPRNAKRNGSSLG